MTIHDIDGSNDCESESFDTLTQTQRLAIELLAMGHNQTETATQVGKARETISRWKHIPAFEACGCPILGRGVLGGCLVLVDEAVASR